MGPGMGFPCLSRSVREPPAEAAAYPNIATARNLAGWFRHAQDIVLQVRHCSRLQADTGMEKKERITLYEL